MAHHGGRGRPAPRTLGAAPGAALGPARPAPQPRVHRPLPQAPQAPLAPDPAPPAAHLPVAESPPALEPSEVSLATPRPDGQRRVNEYVQTPVTSRAHAVPSGRTREPYRHSVTLPVRQQPTTFKKDLGLGPHPHAIPHPQALPPPQAPQRTSILCPGCGRCRCEACQERRPLPSRWLCDDSCFCSAETTVDYATCLCCVKGLFYHCGGEDREGVWCADDPCSCAPGPGPGASSRRCARWSCLALASAVLPCLLCYWPLRGLVHAAELCYARYCDNGCRCERRPRLSRPQDSDHSPAPATPPRGLPRGPRHSEHSPALLTPEKRLLDTD